MSGKDSGADSEGCFFTLSHDSDDSILGDINHRTTRGGQARAHDGGAREDELDGTLIDLELGEDERVYTLKRYKKNTISFYHLKEKNKNKK